MVFSSEETAAWHLGHWRWCEKYLRKNRLAIQAGEDPKFEQEEEVCIRIAQIYCLAKIFRLKYPEVKSI